MILIDPAGASLCLRRMKGSRGASVSNGKESLAAPSTIWEGPRSPMLGIENGWIGLAFRDSTSVILHELSVKSDCVNISIQSTLFIEY